MSTYIVLHERRVLAALGRSRRSSCWRLTIGGSTRSTGSLRAIVDKFGGGPVNVVSLAAAISEERDAIEDIYEPSMIQAGFLDRTPRGRLARARAYQYFGLTAPGKEFRLW
jgi:Holliday junction resolvasome RuvABC ATP-dependent DNA helicase subunit